MAVFRGHLADKKTETDRYMFTYVCLQGTSTISILITGIVSSRPVDDYSHVEARPSLHVLTLPRSTLIRTEYSVLLPARIDAYSAQPKAV